MAFEQRQSVFGQNRFKELPQKSFFMLLWENLQDPTLILLMIAALVSPWELMAFKDECL